MMERNRVGAFDDIFIAAYIKGYIMRNLLEILSQVEDINESTEYDKQKATILDKYIKEKYGYIPTELQDECLLLNKIEDKKEYEKESEVIYEKYYSYIATTPIFELARVHAIANVERNNAITEYYNFLEYLKTYSAETKNTNISLHNCIPLIVDYEKMNTTDMPFGYDSPIKDRINFMEMINQMNCNELNIPEDATELAEELYGSETDSFRYYLYNGLVLMIKTPNKYVLLKVAEVDFNRPWTLTVNADSEEEVEYLPIDNYNYVPDVNNIIFV